ncbi:hypothetical protein O6H91_Y065600 [Diphasiastrum complanatum]|nr:hypothetical protein O6H91_Y065600 [Diphasiastrum complanatum]
MEEISPLRFTFLNPMASMKYCIDKISGLKKTHSNTPIKSESSPQRSYGFSLLAHNHNFLISQPNSEIYGSLYSSCPHYLISKISSSKVACRVKYPKSVFSFM